jgi:hypothetical protein
VFIRSSTIQARPSLIDAGITHMHHSAMPALSHVDGFVGVSLMVERESGRCIASSAWRSEQAMHSSADRVRSIRDTAVDAFGGTVAIDEWEVVVMHRAHHARPGACMRATWSRTDPANLEAAIDTFKFGTLSRIEDLPGFCSASLMVNRRDGRAVVCVGYDDRDALDLSREAGASIRADAVAQTGLEVTDIHEFDLEIAHLHVPEMV